MKSEMNVIYQSQFEGGGGGVYKNDNGRFEAR